MNIPRPALLSPSYESTIEVVGYTAMAWVIAVTFDLSDIAAITSLFRHHSSGLDKARRRFTSCIIQFDSSGLIQMLTKVESDNEESNMKLNFDFEWGISGVVTVWRNSTLLETVYPAF
jgi:hypothetical protein